MALSDWLKCVSATWMAQKPRRRRNSSAPAMATIAKGYLQAGRKKRRRRTARRVTSSELLESRQLLTTIVVDTRFDLVDPNDGLTSFREALALAGDETANPGHDTITFAEGMDYAFIHADYGGFDENGDPFYAPHSFDDFIIDSDVTIDASNHGFVRIGHERGFAHRHRILTVEPGVTASLINVFIQGGDSNNGDGAGIRNAGDLTLIDSAVGSNYALGDAPGQKGGGIYNAAGATLTLRNSHIGEISLDSDFLTGLGFDANRFAETEQAERESFQTFQYRGEDIVGKSTDDGTLLSGNGAYGHGGGIYNDGTLHVENSVIRGNRAAYAFESSGSGIYNAGVMTIVDSVVEAHSGFNAFRQGGAERGGGIYNAATGTLTVERTAFRNNVSPSQGAAIFNDGTLDIADSVFDGNRAFYEPGGFGVLEGGAIYDAGLQTTIVGTSFTNGSAEIGGAIFNDGNPNLVLDRVTVAQNTANEGGGIYSRAGTTTTIRNSTIARNSASNGGGLNVSGATTLFNSIIAENGSGQGSDVRSTTSLQSQGYNFLGTQHGFSIFTQPTDIIGGAALLGELGDFGGPSLTIGLKAGSPAIDSGPASSDTEFDQRGIARNVGTAQDRGAFESQAPTSMRVDTLSDVSDGFYGTGEFSLREAIEWANHIPGPDEIAFDADFLRELGDGAHTIELERGTLVITDDLSIHGPGADVLRISGLSSERIFDITFSTVVTLADMTLADGRAGEGSGGGAIQNRGDLTLRRMRLTENRALGGGLATEGGGGVYSSGPLVIDSSTIDNNFGVRGGGVRAHGSLLIVNSTISSNRADQFAGGVLASGNDPHRIISSTITGNSADSIGGLMFQNGSIEVGNTIIAGNTATGTHPDLQDLAVNSLGYNVIGIAPAGSGFVDGVNNDQVGSSTSLLNPVLGKLRDFGDGRPVHSLLPGSPAIEGANPNDFPRFDQRGVARPIDIRPDTGSFEYLAPTFTSDTIVVNSLDGFADGIFGDGEMSLTEAILFLNTDASLTRIEFAPELFDAEQTSPRVVELESTHFTGLAITDSLTIVGPGADRLRLNADGMSRVFTIGSGSNTGLTVSISGLTISGAGSVAAGGGLINYGTTTLDDIYITDNTAAGGGGLFNVGTLTVTNSTIAGNSVINDGGAVNNLGTATFLNTTISGNSAGRQGGGIYTQQSGTTELTHVTITGNTADIGGGFSSLSGTLTRFANSIIAGNTATTDDTDIRDEADSVWSRGGNVLGVTTGVVFVPTGADRTGTAANPLVPLMTDLVYARAATTPVHVLLPDINGNPALNAGLHAPALPFDQRGVARNQVDGYDAGAFELGPDDRIDFTWDDVLVVDRYDDTVDGLYGPGELTLREAIILANAFDATTPTLVGGVPHDVIRFCNGVQQSLVEARQEGLEPQLVLTRGAIDVVGNIIIDPFVGVTDRDAIDRSLVVIDAGGADRAFNISEPGDARNVSAILRNLTITNGHSTTEGGAIRSHGDLMLDNVVIENSHSVGDGGAIAVMEGNLLVRNSALRDNTADSGGAIYSHFANSDVSVIRSTIDNNTADGFGGGIYTQSGTLNVTASTISNNGSNSGGGIFARSTVSRIENSTISGNTGNSAGGLSQFNSVGFLINSTVTENRLPNVTGGLSAAFDNFNSDLRIANTIIAGNTERNGNASEGERGVIRSFGGNLFGSTSGFTQAGTTYFPNGDELVGVDPMLGPLADNGGPTFTHRLNPASPAIDAGSEDYLPLTDQRGLAMVDIADPQNGGSTIPDIGSYELQRLDRTTWTYETSSSQFGAGPALTYGFGFDDGGRGSGVDPKAKFLGVKWDTGPLKWGGIEEGLLGDKYGGQIEADFSGKLGFDVGFYVNSGSVDVSYDGDVNYVIDSAADGSQATVSAFVDIADGTLRTISPKIGAYLDLVLDFHADLEATACLVGCVHADLINIHFSDTLELLAINRQMTDDAGRPLFLNDFGEPVYRHPTTRQFHDFETNEPLGVALPVIPLFDGDVRYLELPIQEIAEGVIRAAKTAREKVKEVLEDRKAANAVDDAKREFNEASDELNRQNERLRKAEERQRNPASGEDFMRARQEVIDLAGKDYADAIDAGTEKPAKKGSIAEAENAQIDAHRKRQDAERKLEQRRKKTKAGKQTKLRSPGLGLVLDVGEANGPLLGVELGIGVGASAGPFSFTRNVGTLQATLPDVNLLDATADSRGRLSASTDDFRPHSDQDERRQIAKAQVDLAALIPVIPGGKYNVTAGPISVDITTVSYNLGPQLNVNQDVSAVPVNNGLTWKFFDLSGSPVSTTVTVNGSPFAGGSAVHELRFNNGDQVVVAGIDHTGNDGINDPIIVQPSLTIGSRFTNDIGLDIELEGVLEALAFNLSAFGVDIIDVGPLFRHQHTLGEFDIGSVFNRTFDLPTETIELAEFRLFEQVSDGKTLDTALMTSPTGTTNEAAVDIASVRVNRPTFVTSELVDMTSPDEFFRTLTIDVTGTAGITTFPQVLDDRLTVSEGSLIGQFIIDGFTEDMINDRSSAVFALTFSSGGSATVTTVRSNPAARTPIREVSSENEATSRNDQFDQVGVRSVLNNDIDDNGVVDPETDGVLLIRFLAGFRGDALTDGALGENAQRANPAEIAEFIGELMNATFLDENGQAFETLDIDADGGSATGLGDGILLARYLDGRRGSELIERVLGPSATRSDSGDVVAYIEHGRSSASEEVTTQFDEVIDRSGGDPLGLEAARVVDPSAVVGSSAYIPVTGTSGASADVLSFGLSTFGQTINIEETYFDSIGAGNLASRTPEGSPASFADASRRHLIEAGGSTQPLVLQTVTGTLGVDEPLFIEGPDAAVIEFRAAAGATFQTLTLNPRVGGNLYLPAEFDLYLWNTTQSRWQFDRVITSADPNQLQVDGNVMIDFGATPVDRLRLYSRAIRNRELHDSGNDTIPDLRLVTGFTLNASGTPTIEREVVTARRAFTDVDPVQFSEPVSVSDQAPVASDFSIRRSFGRVFIDSTTPNQPAKQDAFVIASTEVITINGHDNVEDTLTIDSPNGPIPTRIRFDGGFRTDTVKVNRDGVVLDLIDRSSDDAPRTLQQAQATPLDLSDVEVIDISGSGANTLLLDVDAVLRNDPYEGTLTVLRDADDTVDIGQGWELHSVVEQSGTTFDVYVSGRATLLVEQVAGAAIAMSAPALFAWETEPPFVGTTAGKGGRTEEPSHIQTAHNEPSVAAQFAASPAAVDIVARSAYVQALSTATFDVAWSPVNGQPTSEAGLDLRLHYDSSQLTFDAIDSLFESGFTAQQDVAETELTDDGDPATDRVLHLLWYDLDANWPNVDPGTTLLSAHFTAAETFGSSTVNVRATTTAGATLPNDAATVDLTRRSVVTSPVGDLTDNLPTFTWTDVPGAVDYDLYISSLTAGVAPFIRETVSDTNFTPSESLPIGRYRVWVNARLSDNTRVGWSVPVTFAVRTPGNVTSPEGRLAINVPTFEWDAIPGAEHYYVWINDNSGVVYRNETVTGTSLTLDFPLDLGHYRIWVRGVTSSGFRADWSPVQRFTIATQAEITAPVNSTFDRSPEVTWNAVPGADFYELSVRNLATGEDVIREFSLTGTSYTPATDLPDGRYRFWVKARVDGGVHGFWSQPQTIHIDGRPELLAPFGTTTNSSPTITWQAVDGAASYILQVNHIGGESRIILETVAGTSFTPATALPSGSFRFWVRAIATSGELSPWSWGRDFEIV